MPRARTPAQLFFARASRRMRDAEPSVRAAYLRSLHQLAESLPMGELEALIATGAAPESVVLLLDRYLPRALVPLRASLQATVTRGALLFARDVPGTQRSAYVVRLVSTGMLNTRVADAVRLVDGTVTARLAGTVRESVRAILKRGITEQQRPRTIARELRQWIGLSKSELQQVANFRDALTGANGRRWEDYARRDHRYDRTVRKALESGKGLSAEQVDRMTATYARRRLALSAESNARTATREAYKRAQKAAWQTAIDAGLVNPSLLMKEWIGIDDGRERPNHLERNGEVVPFDALFGNGDDLPGDTDPWNCRCWPRYYIARERGE